MPHEPSWFTVREHEPGIVQIVEPHHVEAVSSWLIVGTDRAILLDTGMGVANIRTVVESITSLRVTVVNSHADWDHIGGNALFDRILIHPAEAHRLPAGYPNDRMRPWFAPDQLTGPLPADVSADSLAVAPSHATGFLGEGDVIDPGNRRLTVLHCPGHSPGLIALHDEANRLLFSTDIAYDGPLYATRGPALVEYAASLRRLAELAPDLRVVYPSHNRCLIEPGLLPPMATAIQQILDGAQPVSTIPGRATYRFGPIEVCLEDDIPDDAATQV